MHENQYAVNAQDTPENRQKFSSINLHKTILTGPAELANHYIGAMLHTADFSQIKGQSDAALTAQHIAEMGCMIAQSFWDTCRNNSWLLDQAMPAIAPEPITGTSHVDLSNPEAPRSMSHEEFLAQGAVAPNVSPFGGSNE